MMGLRILCTGDLHVGRRPSRMGASIEPRRYSCAAMLGEIVEYALREHVDAVAISGDIVDKANKYYEAFGPVERALKRLAAAGIDVFAVAGNHDFDVLPRLVDTVGSERFHLLGRSGTWEHRPLYRGGSIALNFVGWSFPAEHVPQNPMIGFAPGETNGKPVLALLHADLDQPDSRYAPVPLRDLQKAPVNLWLLGHVHKSRHIVQSGCPAVLYPGSPQAMDPGETGAHGPWLAEIDPAGRVELRHIPMSRVRYDQIDIDLTGIDTREAFDTHVPLRLAAELRERCRDCGPLEHCSCRLRFLGATPLHRQLKSLADELKEQLALSVGGFIARIDEVTIDTRPPVDLERLALGTDVPADLARLILKLRIADAAEADVNELINRAVEIGDGLCTARAYQPLSLADFPSPDSECARESMLRQGMLLLDALLAQKGER